MRGGCCYVAVGITVWTILHLKTFLQSCLPLDSELFTGRSVLWPNNSSLVWETGEWHHSILWKTGCRWAPLCSLLSPGKAWKMGTKEFVLRSQSQKLPLQRELTQALWTYLQVCTVAIIIVNQTRAPDNPSLLKINVWTMSSAGIHGDDYLPLASYKDSLLLFPIFSISCLPFPISLNY